MDLESRKILFVQEFLRLQNEEVISGLEKVLHKFKQQLFEKNLSPMTLEQFEAEIKLSLEDSTQDNVINAKDLKDQIQGWD